MFNLNNNKTKKMDSLRTTMNLLSLFELDKLKKKQIDDKLLQNLESTANETGKTDIRKQAEESMRRIIRERKERQRKGYFGKVDHFYLPDKIKPTFLGNLQIVDSDSDSRNLEIESQKKRQRKELPLLSNRTQDQAISANFGKFYNHNRRPEIDIQENNCPDKGQENMSTQKRKMSAISPSRNNPNKNQFSHNVRIVIRQVGRVKFAKMETKIKVPGVGQSSTEDEKCPLKCLDNTAGHCLSRGYPHFR